MRHIFDNQDDKKIRSIAYFSMEIGLDEGIPTYSGGLGVLAGDTIKTFSDLRIPAVAISLISRKGYFKQEIRNGVQAEMPVEWHPEKTMKLMPARAEVSIEGRKVYIAAWEYKVKGISGFNVPIYFLDTDLPENAPEDRGITDCLYGGDNKYRIKQEVVLGIGGVRIIEALGYIKIKKYHMNEGHSAFLIIELMKKTGEFNNIEEIRKRCVFTTHTPVPAGHDQFDITEVESILGAEFRQCKSISSCHFNNKVNMTLLALNHSEYINGVAQRHREISRTMFPGYPIDSITNGVHSLTWTCDEFKELFDRHIPGWSSDPFCLRYALKIPRKEIWEAHVKVKKKFIDYVNSETKIGLDYDVFTISFARRSTPYKRLDLFFRDIDKLIDIYNTSGKFQVIMGGKAHPRDEEGKRMITHLHEIIKKLGGKIKAVYLQNYDIRMAKLFLSGTDLWLNTPRRPWEASGTSGMKAAHNGIPQLSVLDGWWLEGHIENATGWSIGKKDFSEESDADIKDAEDMYIKLKNIIIPTYYHNWDKWTEIMRHTIAFNASFFNTHRMVHQYVLNSYFD